MRAPEGHSPDQREYHLEEVTMTVGSTPHPSLKSTLAWLEERIAFLEAAEDYEASYALTAEHADWLLGSPDALNNPLTVPPAIASLNS